MILSWMLYILVISALAGAAALLGERSLRLAGLPGRWVWLAALVFSLALPPAAWMTAGERPLPAAEAVAGGAVGALGPVEVVTGDAPDLPAWLAAAEGAALLLWLAASVLLLLLFAGSSLALRLARRGWPSLDGGAVRVRVSPHLGPAVVGFLRPVVVLPRWAVTAGEEVRTWILCHESEHLRARDPLLLLAGLAAVVLCPWNAALWWQLRRLRLAVELDCDARVLRGRAAGERRDYGALLLEVGRRSRMPRTARPGRSGIHLAGAGLLAGFSEAPSFLERRIRAMTDSQPRHPARRAAVLIVAGAFLVVGACMAPEPDRPTLTEPETEPASPAPVEADGGGELQEGPAFTPYTEAPSLLNADEVRAALEREYPPILRQAGIGGRAAVYFFIDETGVVRDVRLNDSSGHEPLDAAALRVGETMRFTPARNGDEAVPVWISLPITFTTAAASDDEGGAADGPEARSRTAGERSATTRPTGSTGPTFTPYTVAPALQNTAEVREALAANYPTMLRDAGISGRVLVYLFVDTDGWVKDVRVNRSSGHVELDRAALEVAGTMRFTPALNRDEEVPVWISLPVSFEAG